MRPKSEAGWPAALVYHNQCSKLTATNRIPCRVPNLRWIMMVYEFCFLYHFWWSIGELQGKKHHKNNKTKIYTLALFICGDARTGRPVLKISPNFFWYYFQNTLHGSNMTFYHFRPLENVKVYWKIHTKFFGSISRKFGSTKY